MAAFSLLFSNRLLAAGKTSTMSDNEERKAARRASCRTKHLGATLSGRYYFSTAHSPHEYTEQNILSAPKADNKMNPHIRTEIFPRPRAAATRFRRHHPRRRYTIVYRPFRPICSKGPVVRKMPSIHRSLFSDRIGLHPCRGSTARHAPPERAYRTKRNLPRPFPRPTTRTRRQWQASPRPVR